MQLTRCDRCSTEVAKQGLARLKGWAAIRISERVTHEVHLHIEQTEIKQYELCDKCLIELKEFLGISK